MPSELENHFVKCTVMSLYQHCDENVANVLRVITDTLRSNGRPDINMHVDAHGAVLTVTQSIDRVMQRHHNFSTKASEIAAVHGSPVRRSAPLREVFHNAEETAAAASSTTATPTAPLAITTPPRVSKVNQVIVESEQKHYKEQQRGNNITRNQRSSSSTSHHVRTYNGDYMLRRYGGKAYNNN
eukprot:PhF_6_TR38337/c0_g1_i2/m.57159